MTRLEVRRFPAPPKSEVFAVGTGMAQVVWRDIAPGELTVHVRSTTGTSEWSMSHDQPGGPGSLLLDRLDPGRSYRIELASPGASPVSHAFTTLEPPPGELLSRIATVNDVHLGCEDFGMAGTMKENPPHPEGPASERCARAAFAELKAWGAEHLVIKGDFVDEDEPAFWDLGLELVRELDLPWDCILGNHETRENGIPHEAMDALGYSVRESVRVRDLPGVRMILADTALPLSNRGRIAPLTADIVDAAADADGPVIVWLHHQLQQRKRAWMIPAGISGSEASPFLAALDRARPGAFVASGHTHRHRRWRHGSVTVVETGSTKDYPGTWAGYDIHEGGLRQVVRRVAAPSCLRWTNYTTRAALGAWGRWSPGRLDERCFTLTW